MLVAAPSFHRSLLLLEALIAEARRRGYGVTNDATCKGLDFVVAGHSYEVTIKERVNRSPHQPTAAELREKERGHYVYMPSYDYTPSGQLIIRSDHSGYGADLATEGVRWRLEDRLGRVFERLEAMAEADEARDQERIREEERRRAAWEAELVVARTRYYEHHRQIALKDVVKRMRLARDARSYIAAARPRTDLTEADNSWLDWVEQRASEVDPLVGCLAPPPPPEPAESDLREFCRIPCRVW